jgi:hypothetical protein
MLLSAELIRSTYRTPLLTTSTHRDLTCFLLRPLYTSLTILPNVSRSKSLSSHYSIGTTLHTISKDQDKGLPHRTKKHSVLDLPLFPTTQQKQVEADI